MPLYTPLAVLFFLGLAAFLAFVVHLSRTSEQLAPEEADLVPLYCNNVAVSLGSLYVQPWMVRVTVYTHCVVIACPNAHVIPLQSIREVTVHRGLFRRCVRIVHDTPSLPSPVRIWVTPPEPLAAAIRGVAPHAFTAS